MNMLLRIPLSTSADQRSRLLALQEAFAEVCNELAPMVRETRCWNRVVLHHMAYRGLRERFPALGSQMVCNVIYSVCRASRLVYQHPASPFNLNKLAGKPLPLLKFGANSPVYFDRHTLSFKNNQLSLFTLGGRMRFHLSLSREQNSILRLCRLREIVLLQTKVGDFELLFDLSEISQESDVLELQDVFAVKGGGGVLRGSDENSGQFPDYLIVEDFV